MISFSRTNVYNLSSGSIFLEAKAELGSATKNWTVTVDIAVNVILRTLKDKCFSFLFGTYFCSGYSYLENCKGLALYIDKVLFVGTCNTKDCKCANCGTKCYEAKKCCCEGKCCAKWYVGNFLILVFVILAMWLFSSSCFVLLFCRRWNNIWTFQGFQFY